MAEVKPAIETFAKIKVIGVGGSGNSAVNRMVRSKIKGVEFIVANTDVQALQQSQATLKIHLGRTVTRGLGAGMNPEVGKAAAEESQNEIRDALKGADMVFITCGLGGGTGSGASPVIAEIAKDLGALTVAVVTKPFSFEMKQRATIAEKAYAELASRVDTIIAVPNDRILQLIDKKTALLEAFETVDDVLRQGVQGISELITVPGLINVDFADVKAVMTDTGSALMGIGLASGDSRAVDAARQAIMSPLLEVSIDGAKGILFTIAGGSSLTMHEVSEAAKVITGSADENARVIFGAVIDENLKDEVKVCVVATGFDDASADSLLEKRSADANYYVQAPKQKVSNEESRGEPRAGERRVGVEGSRGQGVKNDEKETAEKERVAERMKEKTVVASSVRHGLNRSETVSRERETAKEEEPARSFLKRAIPVSREPQLETVASAAATATEEDLEIPAFIRRKLG